MFVSAIVFAACELAETELAPVEPRLVVHAVLNPGSVTQVLLLERTWDGDKYIWKTGRNYTQTDPIGGGGGYGEILAEVDLILPDGSVRRATEPRLFDGSPYGAGVYFLPISGSSLTPGAHYRLHIRTANGEELTSATTVPSFQPTVPIEEMNFDRQRDTAIISWPRRAGARAYHVVLQSPYGQTSFFTDTTVVRLTGSLRSVSIEGLPRVFIPGFTQSVTIVAVDSNYYDYFRSSTHSQTGTGIVNRVQGGLGVFGAVAPAVRRRLRVTAPFVQPFEGSFRYLGSPEDSARTLMIGLTLYLESSAAKSDAPDAISGQYRARPGAVPAAQLTGGMLGFRWRDSLRLVLLNNQQSTDTLEVFRARIAGDTITGTYRSRVGTWRFLKQR
jgi:hypothetical protein